MDRQISWPTRTIIIFCIFLMSLLTAPAFTQNNNWAQQQQQQQRQQDQQRQQMQDQQRQQMQDQQRRQMQDQQRRQMQDQQRQQMQDQQRRQMQDQQRQQFQQQQRQQLQDQQRQQFQQQQRQQLQGQQKQQLQGQQRQQLQAQQSQQTSEQQRRQMQQQGKLGNIQLGANKASNVATSSGIRSANRPPTPGEIQRGFTGKITPDGKALIKFGNRIVTVPASRVSGRGTRRAANDNRPRSERLVEQQKNNVIKLKALAANNSPSSNSKEMFGQKNGGSNSEECQSPSRSKCIFNKAATSSGPVERIKLKNFYFAYGLQHGTAKKISAAEVNERHLPDKKWDYAYKENRDVYSVRGRPSEKLVRLYHDDTRRIGHWLVPEKEIRGKTPKQIREHLALDQEPTHISEWTPTKEKYDFYVGISNEQTKLDSYPLKGGGIQIELAENPIKTDFSKGESIDEWQKKHR